jgi:hypothetical protein
MSRAIIYSKCAVFLRKVIKETIYSEGTLCVTKMCNLSLSFFPPKVI